ncbi:MAG: hypothetical protein A3C50_04180 [Candidatus Staskawiczbacteria bacterium RIFCSPHIGHO2_02_FULL_43_16]|nr:MAG: hypothetical protein A3C50_04180 [Candidatus Staskawiczbacteria bacterium RIFCSPHIGHO2_02_FULL_43_16]
MPEPGEQPKDQVSEEALEVEEVLEAEPYEPIMDGIVFTEVKKKKGGVEYRSSDPTRKIIMLSESSEKPKPNRPYKVKIIEDTDPGDPNKGKLIGEIYYESRDEKAKQFIEEINALKQAAKTKEDYQQLANLYQHLEGLYESKEGGKELEASFAMQYDKQVEIFYKLKILVRNLDYDVDKESMSPGSIDAIDGNEYKFPSKLELAELIEQNKELIEKKKEQGFTKLLVVPFGMKLDELAKKYGELIIEHFKNGNLHDSEGKKIENLRKQGEGDGPTSDATKNSEYYPLWKWDKYTNADESGGLVYYPEKFDKNNHQGKTKAEAIKEQGGWNIILIEDMPDIPRQGKGKTVGDRKQLEARSTPKEYLQTLATDPVYQHESGMTPEDQLMYAITYLEENQKIMDDYQGKGSVSYQIGAYFPSSDDVPHAYWYRGHRQAYLSGSGVDDRHGGCGVRSAVRIKKS